VMKTALALIRQRGADKLTVDAVLSRAKLGTRAFYRHFDSKNHLIVEIFVRAAEEEAARLRRHMVSAHDPLDAVVAWIDCRLDLAFDPSVRSDLRHLSEQAQGVFATAPQTVELAYATMLAPLVEALERWRHATRSSEADAIVDARTINSVVWGVVQQQWARGDGKRAPVRRRTVMFCLRGIGARPVEVENAVTSRRRRHGRS
jgi:AcrR family transcriptional regulator